MGRKAKKRAKPAQIVSHEMDRLPDSDGHVDIIGDHEEHMLEFKRLKENGSIDMMLDDLDDTSADHDLTSMGTGELSVGESGVDVLGDDYHSKVASQPDEPEPCHSDSDIIKSDIFDPAYEMHQNLVSSMGEYGAAFLNGMDHEGMLDVKHDPPPLPNINPTPPEPPHVSVSLESAANALPATLLPQQPAPAESIKGTIVTSASEPDSALVSKMVTRPDGGVPEELVGSLPPTSPSPGEPPASLGQVVSTISTAIPSVIPGAIPISPLFLPSAMAGLGTASVNATSTALAHISKIEPGADGKGYVLHLTIPALGLGNVMLSTEGLTFAHPDPKLGSPGSAAANVPCSPSDEQVEEGSFSPCLEEAGSPDEVNINVDTDSPSPMSYPSDDNPVADPAPDLDLEGSEVKVKGSEVMEEDVFSAGSFINTGHVVEGVVAQNDCASSTAANDNHILGSVVTAPPEQSISCEVDIVATGSDHQGSEGSEIGSNGSPLDLDADLKLTAVVEHNSVDKPEVDRFVICSDGPMVCVLCAFKTDSYSAFKSHIICSHPCWRITKKLSKNRLLVEKSVKMNTSLVHTNFNMPPSICNRKAGDHVSSREHSGAAPQAANSASGSSSTAAMPENNKTKKVAMHPRKKQLIERNKRLFRCTKCLRLFVFEGSIVNHLMDYHGLKKPYDYIMVSNDHGHSFGNIHRCSHKNCYVTCTSEVELERHRLESHAQVVFRCQICGYTADNAQAIKAHAVRIHHQQIREYGPSD